MNDLMNETFLISIGSGRYGLAHIRTVVRRDQLKRPGLEHSNNFKNYEIELILKYLTWNDLIWTISQGQNKSGNMSRRGSSDDR